MKRKYLIAFVCLALVAVCLCVSAVFVSAEETVVYVDAKNGNDLKDGTTEDTALRTFRAAFAKLADNGGTIVLTSDYTLSTHYTTPEYKKQVTITAKHGGKDYGAKLRITGSCLLSLNGDTVIRDLAVYQSNALTFVANFHSLVIDEGFSVESATESTNVSIVGGYWQPSNSTRSASLNSNVTVNSGEFNYIVGFTRKKGSVLYTHTGTSNITVNGGSVRKVFGGTSEYHYGGSTVITINGGEIGEIHTAGDVTRQLKGTATVHLNGGKVGILDVNNVMKDAVVNINGAELETIGVSYASDTLKADSEKNRSTKTIRYNSLVCPRELIDTFDEHFDVIENNTVQYVQAGGKGEGNFEADAIGSLSAAYEKLKYEGGRIVVLGEVNFDLGTNKTPSDKIITITGKDDKSVLKMSSDVYLSANTTIENIKIATAKQATLYACFKALSIENKVTTEGDLGIVGSTRTAGKGNVSLNIKAGSYTSVVGVGSACANYAGDVSVVVGDIKTDLVTLSECGSAKIASGVLSVADGEHKKLSVCEAGRVTGKLTASIHGSVVENTVIGNTDAGVMLNISSAEFKNEIVVTGLGGEKSERKFTISEIDESKIAQIREHFTEDVYENAVYVQTGGDGNGRSPDSPVGDLDTAIKLLGGEGKVIVCGPLVFNKTQKITEHSYPVTITSVGNAGDFRKSGAYINFEAGILLGGDTTIEKINFATEKTGMNIYAMANKLVIGDEVETTLTNPNAEYINILGGRNDALINQRTDVTINSGKWGVVRAGGNYSGVYEDAIDINLTINGGTFHKYVALASRGKTEGKITCTINGGTFYQSIYAVYEEDGSVYKANYDVVINLNGGKFYQMIAPACSFSTTIHGKYTVNVAGGDFAHLTDMIGTELYIGSMTSFINIAENVNINEEVTGTGTFTNPVRPKGPDPWVFYYDGSYYYTHTTGSTIVLMKVQNISDIGTSAERAIIRPTTGQNMWSPEIHYFSEEEVGAEYAGWYLYIGFDDGTTANQRQHVLKCLDGDNLLGRWGDPVTGKVNVPRKVEVPNAPHYNVDELCGGSSKIIINGKTYMTFISEVGRGTADFHQTVNITEIENPWTYKSVPTTICVPEYQWEMGGYGYSESKNGWYPKVVEGASAVYSDNGDVYLMYTGSGYWTIYYQLGYLKFLGGDPMDAKNWQKNPTPVLSLSSEVNGCGHGSYFKDHEGNYYVAYHGYVGKDASGDRYAHIERIYVTSEGITIGNGSGHPAPLATEYTISLNPLPLAEKIDGFVAEKVDNSVTTKPGSVDKNDQTTDTGAAIDTAATDTPAVKGGNVSTTTAIIIIVAVVIAVAGAVVAVLFVNNKKCSKK